MKLIQHRGFLDDSMSTAVEIEPTIEALETAINKTLSSAMKVEKAEIHVKHYGYDERTGWDEHIVTIDDYGVFGFTDGPLMDNKEA